MGNVDGDLGHATLLVFTLQPFGMVNSTPYLEESPQEPHGDDEVAQDGDAVSKVPVGHCLNYTDDNPNKTNYALKAASSCCFAVSGAPTKTDGCNLPSLQEEPAALFFLLCSLIAVYACPT